LIDRSSSGVALRRIEKRRPGVAFSPPRPFFSTHLIDGRSPIRLASARALSYGRAVYSRAENGLITSVRARTQIDRRLDVSPGNYLACPRRDSRGMRDAEHDEIQLMARDDEWNPQ